MSDRVESAVSDAKKAPSVAQSTSSEEETPYARQSYVQLYVEETVDDALIEFPETDARDIQDTKATVAPPTTGSAPASAESAGRLPPRFNRADSTMPIYGAPSSAQMREAARSKGRGGLTIHAQVVADDYFNPKHCTPNGKLKARRPRPQAHAKEFFGSIAKSSDDRWFFSGRLNGWPALQSLEVISVTILVKPFIGKPYVKRTWDSRWPIEKRANGPKFPFAKDDPKKSGKKIKKAAGKTKYCRVTLRMPDWSARGWSRESPGFAFYGHLQRERPVLRYGDEMVSGFLLDLEKSGTKMPRAVAAHHFAHRYAVKGKQSIKDYLTYHAGVLVEWDHGRFATVFELAWLNGLGGYGGKSNWYSDRDTKRPSLYAAMPHAMKMPWHTDRAEIRILDIEPKNKNEFRAYLDKYSTGTEKRFVSPDVDRSGAVRLSNRSQADLMRYVLNYIQRDRRYTEESRNCQHFAADFFGFLVGIPESECKPYHTVARVMYKPRRYLFLYDADESDAD